jgi:EAL domain-containing protein (putative c-di-GMP-specific phosphodiesterase class I)
VLRQALQEAIADQQFRVHYQPVVRMADRGLIGAEALARWDHPELGMQSPAQFIPAAEDTGLIVPLGAQVLRMALEQTRHWRDAGSGAPRVAVNVSGVQLRRPDFAAAVRAALAEAGVAPTLLELELTEGALIESSQQTLAVLAELAGIGVTLAVDDFGTGYSSLRYLRDLPVHKLKIDQTFVRNLAVGSRDASIVAAVVAMARGLGLSTTAEGVQTEEQYRHLREVGCDHAQGWLFGAAVRPEAFPGPPL